MSSAHKLPHCVYVKEEPDIHVFAFTRATPRGVDEWLDKLTEVYTHHTTNIPIRCMIECRTDITPAFNYLAQRQRRWTENMPKRPAARLAVIYRNNSESSVLRQLTNRLHLEEVAVNFFLADKRETAKTWLADDRIIPFPKD